MFLNVIVNKLNNKNIDKTRKTNDYMTVFARHKKEYSYMSIAQNFWDEFRYMHRD